MEDAVLLSVGILPLHPSSMPQTGEIHARTIRDNYTRNKAKVIAGIELPTAETDEKPN